MDDLLRNAYERRQRLRSELRTIDDFIARYEQLHSPAKNPENFELEFDAPSPATKRRNRTNVPAMLDAAEAAILAAKRPLSRGTLLRMMEDQGFVFPGTDRTKVFGTNLWRSGRFRSLKGLGYWPEAHRLPAEFEGAEERGSQVPKHS